MDTKETMGKLKNLIGAIADTLHACASAIFKGFAAFDFSRSDRSILSFQIDS